MLKTNPWRILLEQRSMYGSKIRKKGPFFDLTYPKLNPRWGQGSFLSTESCFSLKMDPWSILHEEPSMYRSKIRKKAHFLIWPTPNSTLDEARGHFCLQNLVSRLKWAHKIFYTKNLACIGQKLEKSPFFDLTYPKLNPGWGQGSFLPTASCSSLKMSP